MKRDMDLIRKILLVLEGQEDDRDPGRIEIEGYSPEHVAYHSYLLVDSGLCLGQDHTHLRSKYLDMRATRLTWSGHEFLAVARDETNWKNALDRFKSIGGAITIGILTQLLTQMIKERVGLR